MRREEDAGHQDYADDCVKRRPWKSGDAAHEIKRPQLAAAAPWLNLPKQVGVHRTRRQCGAPDSDSLPNCVGSNTERLAYKLGPPPSYQPRSSIGNGCGNIRKRVNS